MREKRGEQSEVWSNNHGAEWVKRIMKQQRVQDILEGTRILGRQPRQNKEGGKRHGSSKLEEGGKSKKRKFK